MTRQLGGRGRVVGAVLALVAMGTYACSGDPDAAGAPPVGTVLSADASVDGEAPGDEDASAALDGAVTDGGADGGGDADAAPGVPAVRFVGRFDTTSAAGVKVGFPSSEIIARFSGTEVKATFADAVVYDEYGPTRWQVVVDTTSTILEIARAQTTYTLATGLAPGIHTVRLYKLSEAQVGITQFMGFDFSGGTLLAPPPAPLRHLEFLGDSASNGYGVEGACPGGFTSSTENAQKAYPALVAKDLSADHHNLSVSGKGLYQNNYRPDLDVYSVLYPRTLPFTEGSQWAFADYTPDVVWMTLGGNDYDDPDGDDTNAPDAPPFAAFQAKYDEMVTLIRTKHPAAHVVCAVAPSLQDGYPAGYDAYTNVKTAAANVVAAKKAAGDNKIYTFEFTRSQQTDLTGCDGHPNAAKHRAMADEAIAFIKQKTLWP